MTVIEEVLYFACIMLGPDFRHVRYRSAASVIMRLAHNTLAIDLAAGTIFNVARAANRRV